MFLDNRRANDVCFVLGLKVYLVSAPNDTYR